MKGTARTLLLASWLAGHNEDGDGAMMEGGGPLSPSIRCDAMHAGHLGAATAVLTVASTATMLSVPD